MKNTLSLALAGAILITAPALISCATPTEAVQALDTNAKVETVNLGLSGLL